MPITQKKLAGKEFHKKKLHFKKNKKKSKIFISLEKNKFFGVTFS